VRRRSRSAQECAAARARGAPTDACGVSAKCPSCLGNTAMARVMHCHGCMKLELQQQDTTLRKIARIEEITVCDAGSAPTEDAVIAIARALRFACAEALMARRIARAA
jgi:hypothetical protein